MEYKNNNGLNLCDYVSLGIANATIATPADGIFEWIIPTGAYYSNRRGQVCTVEISNGALGNANATVDDIIIIGYENGGFNHYSTGNGRPVIGVCTNLDKYVHGTGQLLCDARPQQIRLKIKNADGTTTGSLVGSITLKFQYYNSIQSTEQLHSEYTSV